MSESHFFSASYVEARGKFLKACDQAGLPVVSYGNPNPGVSGEELFTDVARIGPLGARRTLVASSATHGVEGYCGSGCQIGHLREGVYADLPDDVAVLLIHAINPHGFSWTRRVTEDNVDLNRNNVDHDLSHPENPAYDEIHRMLVPDDWDGPAKQAADSEIERFIATRGLEVFQAALTGGQYSHADGLFYGGVRSTWSNLTLQQIVRENLSGQDAVALIDYHTGLGPYGRGEIICVDRPGSPGHMRSRAWYGDEVTSPEEGSSSSAVVKGTVVSTYHSILPDTEITGIALEYGTRTIVEVLGALRADNWLHLHGDLVSELGRRIKAQIRDAFYPDTDDWKKMVFARSREVTRKAFAGLIAR